MSGRWEPLLEQVVRERYPALVATAGLLVGGRSAAEDLVQDALVSTFVARARFESAAQAEAYVRRAIVSRSLDAARRSVRERTALARVAGERERVVEPADAGFDPALVDGLARLSARQRACVVLRFVEDQSIAETARVLGLSEGSVKRYVHDAVQVLDALLGTSTPVDAEFATVQVKEASKDA